MRHRSIIGRDQSVSPFSAILQRFCDAAGAIAVALVDGEGETVDYAGGLTPFDIKIAAAESAVLMGMLRETAALDWANTRALTVRAARRSLACFALSDGYSLIAVLPRHATSVSARAVQEVLRDLSAEAGLELPNGVQNTAETWARVDVFADAADRRKPLSVWLAGGWCEVEVLGRYTAGPNPRELGYRVRLSNGAELTLIRERRGIWYADELLGSKA